MILREQSHSSGAAFARATSRFLSPCNRKYSRSFRVASGTYRYARKFPRTGLKRTRKVPFIVDRRRKSLFLNGTRHPAPSSFDDPATKAGTERKCSWNSGKWRNRVDTRLHGRLCVCAPAEGRKRDKRKSGRQGKRSESPGFNLHSILISIRYREFQFL